MPFILQHTKAYPKKDMNSMSTRPVTSPTSASLSITSTTAALDAPVVSSDSRVRRRLLQNSQQTRCWPQSRMSIVRNASLKSGFHGEFFFEIMHFNSSRLKYREKIGGIEDTWIVCWELWTSEPYPKASYHPGQTAKITLFGREDHGYDLNLHNSECCLAAAVCYLQLRVGSALIDTCHLITMRSHISM